MASPSFLHIADGSINMSLNSLKKESLKAHIKHSLLFEEKVLFSDSQVINNKNLRTLLFEDSEFLQLFNKDNLVVALRDMIDIRLNNKDTSSNFIHNPSINDVIKGFISWDKCFWENKNNIETINRYAQSTELENFIQSSNIERYSLVSIGVIFSDDFLKLIESDRICGRIGIKLSMQIYELVNKERARYVSDISTVGGIGLAYLRNNLGIDLVKTGFSKEWNKHKDFILDIVHAPYLTALPQIFNANPVYGTMHKKHINLMNGESEIKIIGKDHTYQTSLLQYEIGVNKLPVKSIFKLRQSNEFKVLEYQLIIMTVLNPLCLMQCFAIKNINTELMMRF